MFYFLLTFLEIPRKIWTVTCTGKTK